MKTIFAIKCLIGTKLVSATSLHEASKYVERNFARVTSGHELVGRELERALNKREYYEA